MAGLSVKNWEAQAATNAILAGSLKSLEERVAEFAEIYRWREEADNRMNDLDMSLEDIDKALKDTTEKVGKFYAGARGLKSNQPEKPAEEVAVPWWHIGMFGLPWLEVGLYGGWLLHAGVGLGLLVEVALSADVAIKFMTGFLCFVGYLEILLGIAATFFKRRPTLINAALAAEVWVLTLAAVYLQFSVTEMAKVNTFCLQDALKGDSLCNSLIFRIQAKVFYAIAVMLLTVGSAVLLLQHKEATDALLRRPPPPGAKGGAAGGTQSGSAWSKVFGQVSFGGAVGGTSSVRNSAFGIHLGDNKVAAEPAPPSARGGSFSVTDKAAAGAPPEHVS